AKFGMFIHWGVYSLPGGEWKGKKVSGYAEHLMRKEKITRSEYLDLAHQFNPVKFNAEEWIIHAKNAGMKYFIVTAKHHDGFALYNSAVSDFDITDQTPFKRDPMAELAAAAKKHGMKFGFYYSHAFDWEHPDAPGNDWEYKNPGGDQLIGGANWFDAHPEWLPKAQKYVDEKAIPQIKELLQKYHPDILWFDTPHKLPLSENVRILKAIRETDPNVVVNGRLVRSAAANFGDYKNTADRPAEFYPVTGDWEAIPTTNESYGYHKYDSSHKSVGHFIRLMASAAARGGNLLMNIGPKGDGSFDTKDEVILKGIGKWMQVNGESIYGAGRGPLPYHSWGVSTQKNNKLYLHVFHWPKDGKLYVSGETNLSNGYLLANNRIKIKASRLPGGDWQLTLPNTAPDSLNTVLVFDYKPAVPKDSIHFITRNTMIERFLAFDADQHGKGFSFGDGKTDRYYLEGWKTDQQSVSWRFKKEDPSPGTYKVLIKYLASKLTSGGSFTFVSEQLNTGTQKELSRSKHGISTDERNVIVQELGTITLRAGTFRLSIAPVAITKQELMKLLEVQLIPT
ncbi:MAG: alpha-L-fucosidase, partial [Chitinophagaceae bacterium]|nr:alpha-L-fucosidase [Chitinophagaceae bacterium]